MPRFAKTVLTVVLYRYAESGAVYPAFPADLLERTLRGSSSFALSVARRIEGDRLRRLRRRVLGELEN